MPHSNGVSEPTRVGSDHEGSQGKYKAALKRFRAKPKLPAIDFDRLYSA